MAKKKAKSKAGIYIIIGLVLIGGIFFYKDSQKDNNSITKEQTASESQKVDKDKQEENNPGVEENKDPSETKTPVKNEKPKKNTIPPIPVQESDDRIGEFKVEGIVQAVNEAQQVITIEQVLDDNSQKVSPEIKVSKKAVIQSSNGKLKLSDIEVGATINLIIMKNGDARSVTVVN
jgi:hypothetical protein